MGGFRAAFTLIAALLICGLGAAAAASECEPGFGLNSVGNCVECNQRDTEGNQVCLLCDGDDPSFCYECKESQDYKDDMGYPYALFFYADANGACVECPNAGTGQGPQGDIWKPCIGCENLTGNCTGCRTGPDGTEYDLIDGKCLEEGFLIEIAGCEVPDDSGVRCARCWSYGYGVDLATGMCTECTDPNCVSCAEDKDTCTSCSTGFSLDPANNSTCVPCRDANCGDCPEHPDVCYQCKDGFGVDPANNATCIPCLDANCKQCWWNAGVCKGCKDGYWDDDATGSCHPCMANCKLCFNDAYCATCTEGYVEAPDSRSCVLPTASRMALRARKVSPP